MNEEGHLERMHSNMGDCCLHTGIQCKDKSALKRAQNIAGLISKNPLMLIIPLCVAGLIMGLGTWGLLQGRKNLESNTRAIAQSDGYTAIRTIQTGLYNAMMPVVQIAAQVHLTPNVSKLLDNWNSSAAVFMEAAPEGSIGLILMPQGVATAMYPYSSHFSTFIGFDLLTGLTRDFSLEIIKRQEMVVAGPLNLHKPTLVFLLPVHIHGVAANETWGAPADATDCPVGICYDSTTQAKWWGFVGLMVDLGNFTAMTSPLNYLRYHSTSMDPTNQNYYNVQLKKPDRKLSDPTVFYTPLVPDQPVDPPSDAVQVSITVVSDTWVLYLWIDQWYPRWILSLEAVVVLGALLIAWLVFMLMLSRQEHHALLHSLLPESAIKRIRAQADWTGAVKKNELASTHMETPAQNMLSIIATALKGHIPPVHLLIAVKEALDTSSDVYRPNAEQLLRAAQRLGADDEVRQALMRQLIGSANQTTVNEETEVQLLDLDDRFEVKVALETHEEDLNNGDGVIAVPEAEGGIDRNLEPKLSRSTRSHQARLTQDHISSNAFASSLRPSAVMQMYSSAPSVQDYLFGVMAELRPGQLQYALALLMNMKEVQSERDTFNTARNILYSIGHEHVEEASQTTKLDRCGSFMPVDTNPNAWEDHEFQLARPIADELTLVLTSANEWAFDAFELETASQGYPLSVLAYWLMHNTGLINWGNLNQAKLVNFLKKIESGYPDHPYHNRRHAADVLQSVHVILHRGGLKNTYVENLGQLALYLAAVMHDYEHRGRNNDFLVNAHDDLAVRYNDIAPMENHHLAAAFALLKDKEYNFLAGMSKPMWTKLRKMIIDLVLSTDMKKHFQICSMYEGMAKAPAVTHTSGSRQDKDSSVRGGTGALSDIERQLSMQMLLKCADLGHLTSPLPVHLRWVRGLEEEFFRQGDEERKLNITISPLCDRTKAGVTKSQIGFFEFVAQPLFKHFTDRHHQALPLLHALEANLSHWKSVAAPQPLETTSSTAIEHATEAPERAASKRPNRTSVARKSSLNSLLKGPDAV